MNSQKSKLRNEFRNFLDRKETKKNRERSLSRKIFHDTRNRLISFHKRFEYGKVPDSLVYHLIKHSDKIIATTEKDFRTINDPLFGTFSVLMGYYENDVGYDEIYTIKTVHFCKISMAIYNITEDNKIDQVKGDYWRVWIPLVKD